MRLDVKTTLIILLTLAVLLLATCKSCLQGKYDKLKAKSEQVQPPKQTVRVDTVHKTDSFIVFDHAPIPYKVDKPVVKVQWHFDTLYLEGVDTIFVDTLVGRYYATNYYKKDFQTKYGTITAYDTVSRNKLVGHGFSGSLDIPVVTKTITKTQERTQLYLGIDAYGNKNEIFHGAGASALLKFKKGFAFDAGALWNTNNQLFYHAGFRFLIKLKNK